MEEIEEDLPRIICAVCKIEKEYYGIIACGCKICRTCVAHPPQGFDPWKTHDFYASHLNEENGEKNDVL